MSQTHHHLVLSPKEQLESFPLEQWLKGHCRNYILSLETGTNGHPHLECFLELIKPVRSDSLKRSILRLYPDIPLPEQKNVKICINQLDPNPYYGYGYSLKEGNVITSTFDEFQHADFSEYYESARARVAALKAELQPKKKQFDIDQIADECVKYVDAYYEHRVLKEEPVTWLIAEYLKTVKAKLKFSVYQKINQEKLSEFIQLNLVGPLLDCPQSQIHTTYSSENNPLINSVLP